MARRRQESILATLSTLLWWVSTLVAGVVYLFLKPFEGLAPVVVTRFIDAVNKIKAMGISLLIAESNLMTAVRIADRLYAIDRGEIIFEGSPQAVFENDTVMKTIRG